MFCYDYKFVYQYQPIPLKQLERPLGAPIFHNLRSLLLSILFQAFTGLSINSF